MSDKEKNGKEEELINTPINPWKPLKKVNVRKIPINITVKKVLLLKNVLQKI